MKLMFDKDGAVMTQNHCMHCKKPVGPFHRYNPLAFDDDWIFCDACRVAQDQARREYLASLSWWGRFLVWWREGSYR